MTAEGTNPSQLVDVWESVVTAHEAARLRCLVGHAHTVMVGELADGFDFLGFHHRKTPSK